MRLRREAGVAAGAREYDAALEDGGTAVLLQEDEPTVPPAGRRNDGSCIAGRPTGGVGLSIVEEPADPALSIEEKPAEPVLPIRMGLFSSARAIRSASCETPRNE